ncbi:chemerin-like receptor 1 [Sphaerodactylus townsendi]|uniref:chemerin-like receptor 1 n=1 Tax=Sphaerodactylus townsendi TaxID=933632 RepID=UPI00202638F1|nr:chemerin-like receptor 1 [Sphaerodactylus townsendi]XP_048357795.1 chemerin-like receptor 1 [Sphaerodactylus townsendi]
MTGSTMEANLSALWPTPASSLMSPKAKGDISKVIDMVQVVFYSMVFLIGSLGNGVVIAITARQASHNVNCVFFLNLALADFLFSVSRIVPLMKNAFYGGDWPFGSFLCKANSFTKYLNMFCSVFLLAAISLDRMASVAYPVWSRNNRGPRLAWMAAFGAWLVATAASLPFYFYRTVVFDSKRNETKCSLTLGDGESVKLILYLLRLVCGFLAPFVIIVACYGVIAMTLRQRQVTIRSKKPFKVILVIVITFFLCWAPYHLFLLLKLKGYKGQAVSIGLPLTSCLAYFNSCANPILYFFMGLDFRREINRFNLTRALRRALLEGTVYSLGELSGRKKETPSSVDEPGCSTVTQGVV